MVSVNLPLVATDQGRNVWAALGDGTRRAIVLMLAANPMSVGDLAAQLPVTRPAVSQHLKVLKDAGLVSEEAIGTRRIYRLDAAANAWNQAVLGFNPQRQREVLSRLGMPEPDWKKMGAWLAGLCGSLILALVFLAMRERAHVDPVNRLWQGFLKKLARQDIRPAPWLGPDTLAQQAAAQLPQHAAAIQDIAQSYIALRYAELSSPHRRSQIDTLRRQIQRFRP